MTPTDQPSETESVPIGRKSVDQHEEAPVDPRIGKLTREEAAHLRQFAESTGGMDSMPAWMRDEILAKTAPSAETPVATQPICSKCGSPMSPEDATMHPELFMHDACLPTELLLREAQAETPVCPCCHKADRVVKSDHPEHGEFFCPCNEPGPQYFDYDGSGTLLTTNKDGKPIAVHVDFEGGMHFRYGGPAEAPVAGVEQKRERKHLVESAGYWFKAARRAQLEGRMADALLHMENAYNHVENALAALDADKDIATLTARVAELEKERDEAKRFWKGDWFDDWHDTKAENVTLRHELDSLRQELEKNEGEG